MAEPAPTPSPPDPEGQPRPPGPSSLLRTVQLLALVAVAGLLTLLVWRVVHAGRGGQLVADVRAARSLRRRSSRSRSFGRERRRGRSARGPRSGTGSCRCASCAVTRS